MESTEQNEKLFIVYAGLGLVVLAHFIHIFNQVSYVKISTFRMNELSMSNHIISMAMVIVSGKSQGTLDNPVCERKLYTVLYRLQTRYVLVSSFHVPRNFTI